MCGIYGALGFGVDEWRIDMVSHRGPDGRGWREFQSPCGPVALGHRRLAIIDTSQAGLQPMRDPSGRFYLTYNGEIYNYLELREELQLRGESFATESDSEVLLRAYVTWGERALHRFRGMFAFLIWDDREKRLFAARDRFGIKPIYWVQSEQGVAFGSEIKQLLGLAGAAPRMNLERVFDFLSNGVSDHTSETMFRGVRQLRGGECITVEAGRGRSLTTSIRRWYTVASPVEHASLEESQAAQHFYELLSDSVRVHMRSDVPIGSCLSGGLDSSTIVCLMSELMNSRSGGPRVNTISACFPGEGVDERPFMESVASASHAAPRFVFPRSEDLFACVASITWHQDEPFGSTSIFAQWCVFKEARRAGIAVLLDGQGADEQLAGYHSSFAVHLAHLLRRGYWCAVARTMRERSKLHGNSITMQAIALADALAGPAASSFLRRKLKNDWLESDAFRDSRRRASPAQIAESLLGLPPVRDLATLCIAQTNATNLQKLLHWEDRNSMAHSVEARVPFVDHPLVEYSLALGNDHKIVGSDTKRVLRLAMQKTLPASVRDRRDKLGFTTPEQAWFRGPLRDHMREGVEATLRRYPDLLNSARTRSMAADMLEGRRPVSFSLWRIVSLGIWGDTFGVLV